MINWLTDKKNIEIQVKTKVKTKVKKNYKSNNEMIFKNENNLNHTERHSIAVPGLCSKVDIFLSIN